MQLTIGTRGSPLALIQTSLVLDILRRAHSDVDFKVVTIRTQGDLLPDTPLRQLPRGLFAKELEAALMDGAIDLAVHSFKDLPTELDDRLAIAAIARREDPRDVLAASHGRALAALPSGSRLGTSSPRRLAQIKAYRPDLEIVPIRGNVGTRISKALEGELGGVVLAAAGIKRLGLEREITEFLEPSVCLPAVGQGALAVEVRAGDERTGRIASAANHPETHTAVMAENAVLARLGGGCRTPIAAYARLEGDEIAIGGMVASMDGSRLVKTSVRAPAKDPKAAGYELAEALLALGAGLLLVAEDEA